MTEMKPDTFAIFASGIKIKGQIWISIQTVSDQTQEVTQEIAIPLDAFDQIVANRDSMVRDAVDGTLEPIDSINRAG